MICDVGVVRVTASASWAVGLCWVPALAAGIFPGGVIPVTQQLVLQWSPCQAPGVMGSALGLVGSM